MGFLKNKYVLAIAAGAVGFLLYRWWKRRQAAAPATTGAAAKAAGA
jgi:hypothetical protein